MLTPQEELRAKAEAFLVLSRDDKRTEEDRISTPLPGENLRTFYQRSKSYWSGKAYESTNNRGKTLRRDGCVFLLCIPRARMDAELRWGLRFQLAEERYETYKPVLAELERIQESAGIDAEEATSMGASTAAGATGVDSRHRR